MRCNGVDVSLTLTVKVNRPVVLPGPGTYKTAQEPGSSSTSSLLVRESAALARTIPPRRSITAAPDTSPSHAALMSRSPSARSRMSSIVNHPAYRLSPIPPYAVHCHSLIHPARVAHSPSEPVPRDHRRDAHRA